jgi:hypothetical protein
MSYLQSPNISRQNILFAVAMGLISPKMAEKMMRKLDKVPKFQLRIHRPLADSERSG